jgi:hypothetical protein
MYDYSRTVTLSDLTQRSATRFFRTVEHLVSFQWCTRRYVYTLLWLKKYFLQASCAYHPLEVLKYVRFFVAVVFLS